MIAADEKMSVAAKHTTIRGPYCWLALVQCVWGTWNMAGNKTVCLVSTTQCVWYGGPAGKTLFLETNANLRTLLSTS